MKNQSLKFITLCCALFISLTAFSQQLEDANPRSPKNTPSEIADRATKKMTKALSLSKTQIPKVHAISLSHATDAQAVRANYRNQFEQGNQEANKALKERMRLELQTLLSNTNSKMQTVLSKDQYAKYLVLLEERETRRAEKPNRSGKGKKRG